MAEERKQRFMVNLDDDAMVKIRVLRGLTGKTYQELMSEAVRLIAAKYQSELSNAMEVKT